MTDFKTYYQQYFQRDLLDFTRQIPIEGNKHYNENEFNIQYFFLTPQYKYLNVVPQDSHGLFAVSLFWIVLIDQTFYSNYRQSYRKFQTQTFSPKFIGNCTAPSLMSSECGHHQHPKKILKAINDTTDKGNRFGFDRQIFKKDECIQPRQFIEYSTLLEHSTQIIQDELKYYFENHQPEISWIDFWHKCKMEL